MDLPPETDEYIRESIENSLGLPVSAKTLQLNLLVSEDERRRLQDQIFLLQDRIKESDKRLEQCKAEASMNAQGLNRCIEEKEVMASKYTSLVNHCSELEKECALYELDIKRFLEFSDELDRENKELRTRLKDTSLEVESLKKDKEHLRINLNIAEEEVKVLFEENNILDEENKMLLRQSSRERSGGKSSAGASARGKRKSSLSESRCTERAIDFAGVDPSRLPLSPLQQNSPDSRMHKK